MAEVGEGDSSGVRGYQNAFSLKQSRFIDNSRPSPWPALLLASCALWQEGAAGPAGHSFPGPGPRPLTLWCQILRGGSWKGLQQRKPSALDKAWKVG